MNNVRYPVLRCFHLGNFRTWRTWFREKHHISILETFPQPFKNESAWPKLIETVHSDPKRLVVLDDDPTGCQTVYDCNVLLDYSVASLKAQFKRDDKLFFILTNSRSLSESKAVDVTKEVIFNIQRACNEISYHHPLQILSRSDSTLRGHFPAETRAIEEAYLSSFDGTILMPAFFEGGRVTFDDVHYVSEGDYLIPVGETNFAKDAHFGFSCSDLKMWAMEKYKGLLNKNQIMSISLREIREEGPLYIANKLESINHGSIVIVNAVHQHDMNIFMLGLLQAEANGLNFMYRTAASFVASRAALEPRGLLTQEQLMRNNRNKEVTSSPVGGLIVVGSYVPKTSSQLNDILEKLCVVGIEIDAEFVIEASRNQRRTSDIPCNDMLHNFMIQLLQKIEIELARGNDVVLYTSRRFVEGSTLLDTASLSDFLTIIVAKIGIRPSFLIAKGGITSHDIASKSLQLKSAQVLGQVEPGIPVWKTGTECRFPGINYVVFPGNVGDEAALTRVAQKMGVKLKNMTKNSFSIAEISDSLPNIRENIETEVRGGMIYTLKHAQKQGFAIAAFNVYNLEGAKAVISAAEKVNIPVILQVHPKSLDFGGKPLLKMLKCFSEESSVPVFIQLDHSTEERHIHIALDCEVDCIMVDGSALGFEDNLKWTEKMAKMIHREGVLVEAELGRITGDEDGLSVPEKESKMTDPKNAGLFVNSTKVDLLAVTIGNVHGNYKYPPRLDFPRLEAIRNEVSHTLPLVLHGASGLPQSLIYGAISRGVCKFNVNTDLRNAAMMSIKNVMSSNNKNDKDVLQLMERTMSSMSEVAKEKILLFSKHP